MTREMQNLLEMFRSDTEVRTTADLERHYSLTGHELLALRNRFTIYGIACAVAALCVVGMVGLVVGFIFGG